MKPAIGIDLGGTKIAAALVSPEGQVLKRIIEPTVLTGRTELLLQLMRIVLTLSAGTEIAGVGIGTPGYVDSEAGQVLLATNLPGWTGVELKRELEALLPGMHIAVENDANVAALGEAWCGAGQELESFLMLTLGTGVGGAIYSKSFGLWRGATYRAGEYGHCILYPGGKPCACGKMGCVEQYLAGHALARAYTETCGEQASAEQVFTRAERGDKAACAVVRSFITDLTVLITSLHNIFDPAAFVLSGGIMTSKHVWWDELQSLLKAEGRVTLR